MAAIAVAHLAWQTPDGIRILTDALHDPSPEVRREAADELGSMGPAAAGAADAIRPLLEDPNADVRTVAQRVLKELEPEPK